MMKKLVCEMCNGSDFLKENSVFICQTCGMKYSADEAKKIMYEVSPAAALPDTAPTVKPAKKKKEKKPINKKLIAICAGSVAVIALLVVGFLFLNQKVLIPNRNYAHAVSLMESGDYDGAIAAFRAMQGYKDSDDKIAQCETAKLDAAYAEADQLASDGKYSEAIEAFAALDGYKDSADRIRACETAKKDAAYASAVRLAKDKKYKEAIAAFTALDGYRDSKEQLETCSAALNAENYAEGLRLLEEGKYEDAYGALAEIGDYEDAAAKAEEAAYQCGVKYLKDNAYPEAIDYFDKANDYKDSKKQSLKAKNRYVLDHQDDADELVRTYVGELKKAGYGLITADQLSNVKGGSTAKNHIHLFNAGKKVAATCLAGGYTNYSCSCGATGVGNKTNKGSHNFKGGNCQQHPKCSVCGVESGGYGDHQLGAWVNDGVLTNDPSDWKSSQYHIRVCQICNQVIKKEAHVYDSFYSNDIVHYPKCSMCGHYISPAADTHKYNENGVCTVCGAKAP